MDFVNALSVAQRIYYAAPGKNTIVRASFNHRPMDGELTCYMTTDPLEGGELVGVFPGGMPLREAFDSLRTKAQRVYDELQQNRAVME